MMWIEPGPTGAWVDTNRFWGSKTEMGRLETVVARDTYGETSCTQVEACKGRDAFRLP